MTTTYSKIPNIIFKKYEIKIKPLVEICVRRYLESMSDTWNVDISYLQLDKIIDKFCHSKFVKVEFYSCYEMIKRESADSYVIKFMLGEKDSYRGDIADNDENKLNNHLLNRPLALMIPGVNKFIRMGIKMSKYKELYWPLDDEEHDETHQFQRDFFSEVYKIVNHEKCQKMLNLEVPCHPLTTNVKEDVRQHFEELAH